MVIFKEFMNKNFKASGLIEMMIAMSIFAVAIVAITSLNARNYRQIKANEITDFSNKLMVSSLEYLKSPTTSSDEGVQDIIENALNQSNTGYACFKLIEKVNSIDYSLSSVLQSDCNINIRIDKNGCTANSVYKVSINSTINPNLAGLNICNQIIVKKDILNKGYFLISRVVYQSPIIQEDNSYFLLNEIFGFRPFTYEIQ